VARPRTTIANPTAPTTTIKRCQISSTSLGPSIAKRCQISPTKAVGCHRRSQLIAGEAVEQRHA
jgi:hypothetical protein